MGGCKRVSIIPFSLLLLAVSGCASTQHHASGDSSVTSSASPMSPFVQTSEWAGEGTKLQAMKSSAQAEPGASALPGDYGTWTYETDPTDITSDGDVTLTARVPDSLVTTGIGNGMGYVFPPDKHFTILVKSYDETKNADGSSEIEVHVTISDLRAPYYGFRSWLY